MYRGRKAVAGNSPDKCMVSPSSALLHLGLLLGAGLAVVAFTSGCTREPQYVADFKAGSQAFEKGQYAVARDLYEKVLKNAESNQAPREAVASVLMCLAATYREETDLARVEEMLTKADARMRLAGMGDSLEGARCWMEISSGWGRTGRFDAGVEAARKAVDSLSGQGNEETEWMATASILLGSALTHAGTDATLAENSLRKAMSILEKLHKQRTLDMATAKGSLGVLLQRLGQLEEAQQCSRDALEIAQANDCHDDVFLATCLNNIGSILLYQKKTTESDAYFDRAIETLKRSGRMGDAEMAHALQGKAFRLYSEGQAEQAKPLMMQAVAIMEKVKGVDVPKFAKMLCDLGCVHKKLNEYPDAAACFQRSLDLFTKALGPEDPSTRRVREITDNLKAENKE